MSAFTDLKAILESKKFQSVSEFKLELAIKMKCSTRSLIHDGIPAFLANQLFNSLMYTLWTPEDMSQTSNLASNVSMLIENGLIDINNDSMSGFKRWIGSSSLRFMDISF